MLVKETAGKLIFLPKLNSFSSKKILDSSMRLVELNCDDFFWNLVRFIVETRGRFSITTSTEKKVIKNPLLKIYGFKK